jgi:hypothetical protein
MLRTFGTAGTGLYYVGANVVVLLPALAALPATVLTPRFFERAGRGEDLLPLVETPVRVGSTLLAIALGVGVLALPACVAHLWPALVSGNAASIVALAGTFALVMTGLVVSVFYALNKQLLQLVLLGVAWAVGYATAMLAAWLHPTLVAVAVGADVGLITYYVLVVFAAFAAAGGTRRAAASLLFASLRVATLAALVVVGLNLVLSRFWPAGSIVRTGVSEVVFLAVWAPSLRRAYRALRGG